VNTDSQAGGAKFESHSTVTGW
jgi:hypothetical protein